MSPTISSLPGPLFFLLATLSLSLLAYLVHRWPFLSGLASAAGCLTLAWISARQLSAGQLAAFGRVLTLERSLVILGRTWALTESSLAALVLLYALAGLTFLLALPVSQGWSFYPFGVGALAVLSLAITAQQYVYAILFIWLAANLVVFVLAGGRPGETTAALQFLVFTSLAVMPLLILPRYLDPDPTGYVVALRTVDVPLPDNAVQIATWLMVGGMAVLLMMVPFHGQLVTIGTHSTPMALPLILSTVPVAVLHTLFRLLQAQPALIQDPLFFQMCRWMGTAAALLGGVAAMGQRRWGTLAGYAALVDWGAGLIALGQGTMGAADLAVRMVIWRCWSLLLVGTGWSALFKVAGQKDDVESCQGLFRRRPLSVLTLLLGLFSLAGYPLTPGAAGRWPVLTLLVTGSSGLTAAQTGWLARLIGLTSAQPGAVLALLVGCVGISIGAVSGVCACLSALPGKTLAHNGPATVKDTESAQESGPSQDSELHLDTGREAFEAVVSAGFALFALWLVGSLVLNPQPWLKLAQELLGTITWPGS